MRNLKLLIEYDGTHFHGWQIQPDQRTVQGVLQETIAQVVGHRVRLIGASRTDAGVHALGQVANFKTTSKLPPETMQRAFNALLPDDVVVKAVEEVPLSFHSRFRSTGKVYEYRLLLTPWPSAILRHFCWHLPERLDLEAIEQCCRMLLGVHDFSSFQLSGSDTRNPVREVRRAEVHERSPGHVVMVFEANAFLRGMVRSIVGTLVDVGRGRITPEEFEEIMAAKDRSRASPTAPARGLFLVEVKY
ncbi:MAG TPA: tRNA pseudouridine(38-40) synthase TruA [Deltaproteobacteria bacterium]|nr:tRNA pseudouridine(38-40) synthase TruA [Deltaproteobacteria bacterium]